MNLFISFEDFINVKGKIAFTLNVKILKNYTLNYDFDKEMKNKEIFTLTNEEFTKKIKCML